MFWTVSGWIIALMSLIVNFMLLKQNKEIKDQNSNTVKNTGNMGDSIQQSHSGYGNNVARGR